jgi:DMSO reductase anchor subunit
MATTLVAAEIALGLVFDSRSRDFPFAGLTMAVVPIWTVTLLNRRKSDTGATAEAVFAVLFMAAALYIFLNEGARNWQSLWTSGAFFLFGTALWRSRSVAVLSRMPAVFSKPLRKARLAAQPIAVASVPQPKPQAGAGAGFVAATSKVECDK